MGKNDSGPLPGQSTAANILATIAATIGNQGARSLMSSLSERAQQRKQQEELFRRQDLLRSDDRSYEEHINARELAEAQAQSHEQYLRGLGTEAARAGALGEGSLRPEAVPPEAMPLLQSLSAWQRGAPNRELEAKVDEFNTMNPLLEAVRADERAFILERDKNRLKFNGKLSPFMQAGLEGVDMQIKNAEQEQKIADSRSQEEYDIEFTSNSKSLAPLGIRNWSDLKSAKIGSIKKRIEKLYQQRNELVSMARELSAPEE